MSDEEVNVRGEREQSARFEARLRAINPISDEALQERDKIVGWMRGTAMKYRESADLVGDAYAVTWEIIATLIEQGAHHE